MSAPDVFAFPRQLDGDEINITPTQYGMTLRDWFAAQALIAFGPYPKTQEGRASDAYRMADAMLAAREQSA